METFKAESHLHFPFALFYIVAIFTFSARAYFIMLCALSISDQSFSSCERFHLQGVLTRSQQLTKEKRWFTNYGDNNGVKDIGGTRQ